MRPVALKLHSFGPFCGDHHIDFSKLDDAPLFLVTGDTGAGKTTLFDAIVFALYGKPSGNFRKSEEFKSHFTPPEDGCWVKFTFSLRDRIYTVHREPQRTVTTRNKTTRTISMQAMLTIDDGTQIVGANEVNIAIQELLGLNLQQFKRTVMLAQGEFRAMIEADGKEKQEIFRRIFDTDLYQKITDRIRDAYRTCDNKKNQLNTQIEALLTRIESGIDPELDQLIAEASGFSTESLQKVHERLVRVTELQQEAMQQAAEEEKIVSKAATLINLQAAEKINQQLLRLSDCRAQLQQSDEQQPAFEALQQQLKAAKNAQQLLPDAQALAVITAAIKSNRQSLLTLEENREDAVRQLQKSQEDAAQLPQLSQRRDALLQQKSRLEEQLPLFEAIAEKENDIAKTAQKSKKAKGNLLLIEKLLCRLQKRQTFEQSDAALQLLQHFQSIMQSCEEMQKKFLQQKQHYLHLLSEFLDNQAGVLATHLKDGEPCPVCGSIEHPKKATAASTAVTQQQLEAVKESQEAAADQLRKQAEALAACRSQLLESISKAFPQLLQKRIPSDEELINAEQWMYRQTKQAEQELTELERTFSPAILQHEPYLDQEYLLSHQMKFTAEDSACTQQLVEEERQLSELRRKLPQGVQNREQAEAQRDRLQQEANALQKESERITKLHTDCSIRLEKLQQQKQDTENRLVKQQLDETASREQFSDRLLQQGFANESVFSAALQTAEQVEIWENQLQENQQTRASLKQEIAFLSQETDQAVPINLEQLRVQLAEYQQQAELLARRREALNTRIYLLKQAAEQLSDLLPARETLEREWSDVKLLYDAANGNNAQRIDFERYVLAAYFDDIIASANLRFSAMTEQRYHMKRREDKSKGSRLDGLEIEILDAHTGGYRSISTLSGGESFKAALALALGMADVVQSYSGGISIDTMFIDEGFGTLDANSLTSAIECLIDLNRSSSRMIGIISHVTELKERIPAKICVLSTKQGSKIEITVD